MIKIFLFSLVLISCSNAGEKPELGPLETRQVNYKNWIQALQDPQGFIHSDKCDSVLLSGLIGSVPGVFVNLEAAMDANGKWYRRPAKDCFVTGASKSETSRDMLLGVLYYGWYNKDLVMLETTWQYAEDNDWILGQGPEGRTKVEFWMRGTLAQMIYKLGGQDRIERFYPTPSSLGQAATFNRHLETLHLLIRGEVYGKLGSLAKLTLKLHFDSQPHNPLYSYAHARWNDGDYQRVVDRLLEMYPEDRLPTTADWCEEWVIQRDLGKDWEPCTSTGIKMHSGGDFLFLAFLLSNF